MSNTSSTGTGQVATQVTSSPTQKPMTYADVENTWIQAGGNPQAASMAAAVADASSGFNPGASRTNPDGTVSIGLWLIPQTGCLLDRPIPLPMLEQQYSYRTTVLTGNNGASPGQTITVEKTEEPT